MLLDRLISLLAPHNCVSCGAEGSLLCEWCSEGLLASLPPRCYRCQALTQDSATCKKCRRHSDLRYVWVGGEYAGAAKVLVHKLKFQRTRASATVIARLMDETLPYIPRDVVIAYAPTATSRRRRRGYDQAELIARALARRRNMTFKTLLYRRGHSRQVGADKQTRQTQLAQAFYPNPAIQLDKDTKVLLIDDIVTSGATLEAAAHVLKQSGAATIYAAAFAQKL